MEDRNLDVTERHEELLQSIEEDEEVLREAVHELAEATERKLDITRFIRASPLEWMAGAFCVGLWLGMDRRDPPEIRTPEVRIPPASIRIPSIRSVTAGYRRLR